MTTTSYSSASIANVPSASRLLLVLRIGAAAPLLAIGLMHLSYWRDSTRVPVSATRS